MSKIWLPPEKKYNPTEIDEIRNYFTNNAQGVELFSIIQSDIWEFRFSNTPFFFRIPSNGTLVRIKFFNDVTGTKYTVEEMLEAGEVPESVKKIITWNMDIFSRTFARKNFGWTVTENIGVGIYNPRGLVKLNVEKD